MSSDGKPVGLAIGLTAGTRDRRYPDTCRRVLSRVVLQRLRQFVRRTIIRMKDQPELEMPNRLDNILSGLAVFVGALLILGGCRANDQRIIVSTHKDFEDLFALVDTIQFDESILVAQIISLDVSDEGQFLISDYSSGQIHVFSSSGGYEHSLQTESCPSDTEFRPLHARFLGGGRGIGSAGSDS